MPHLIATQVAVAVAVTTCTAAIATYVIIVSKFVVIYL